MAEKMKIVAALWCGSGKNSRLSVDGGDGGAIAERQGVGMNGGERLCMTEEDDDKSREEDSGRAAEVKVDGGDSRRHGVGSTRMALRMVAERRGFSAAARVSVEKIMLMC
ncbi:hypothetical protein LR48_Vigan08g051700 [Vigna angularis]|uniref:Uncharacterized protein n=1 Tax=Phaseolus angularis TaxID=3914 RepID=A0A0L9V3P3_PHAAN|nr:hypothetical protein LR48_Vigan08g051700 [Vigna angularis]